MRRRQFLQGSLAALTLGVIGVPSFAHAKVTVQPMTPTAPNLPAKSAELAANPLLDFTGVPKYAQVTAAHINPAMDFLIEQSRAVIAAVTDGTAPTWASFYEPMAWADNQLERAWSVVSNLHSVANTDAIREAYTKAQGKLTEFYTWRGMHQGLFKGVTALANSAEAAQYSTAQKKALDDALLGFRLSGIDLPKDKQDELAKITAELAELSNTYSNHVLDATNGWEKYVSVDELKGLNESALASAKAAAADKGKKGYRIGLDMPSYLAVMGYADDAKLRKEVFEAYFTQASEIGVNAGKWNNNPVIAKILSLRLKQAKLLGFNNYAELSLATKMADSPSQVLGFLNDLVSRSQAKARSQISELADFAKQTYGVDTLNPWDVAYYTEKHKAALYDFDKESLRAYFPEKQVLSGLFEVAKRLFGISISQAQAETWDDSVRFYEVKNARGEHIASFYLDIYARSNKRSGGWMTTAIDRIQTADGIQLPVAVLVCNFRKPAQGEPSLLLHEEVTTLFHEFGHGIHLMLTEQTVQGVTGLNGVPWDAVELPSQLMEGFSFHPDSLPLISAHYETGEPLPQALLDKVIRAKNYQGAYRLIRQLEFAIMDMTLHTEYHDGLGENYAYQTYLDLTRRTGAMPQPDFVRRPNTFSHIFAGGYAAGYYSYLWAEQLAADGFAKFKEEGVPSPVVGKRLQDTILSQGGSRPPMDLFVAYRGRKPQIDALLANYGI